MIAFQSLINYFIYNMNVMYFNYLFVKTNKHDTVQLYFENEKIIAPPL